MENSSFRTTHGQYTLCRADHTYLTYPELDYPNCLLYNSSARTALKTPIFYSYMLVRFCGNVFTEPLLRNGRLFIRLLHSNGCTRCLFRGLCLATDLYATLRLDRRKNNLTANFVFKMKWQCGVDWWIIIVKYGDTPLIRYVYLGHYFVH
jgi:hypothetical protein